VAVYRQRTTALDEILLRVVFPWLASAHVTPLLALARIWSEPIEHPAPRLARGQLVHLPRYKMSA
jgi:hypothetical protein